MKIPEKKVIVCVLLLVLSSILFALSWFYLWFITSYYDMQPVSYKHFNLNIPEYNITLTKQELKQEISKLYNVPHFYYETDTLNDKTIGTSKILFKAVFIKQNLSLQDYATTYAHELTHIKYNTANETYTNYMSLIILYESGNIQLKQIALTEMKAIISGRCKNTEYDCGYQLLEYLKKDGINIPPFLFNSPSYIAQLV